MTVIKLWQQEYTGLQVYRSVSLKDAEEIAKAVLLSVFRIEFPDSLLSLIISNYNQSGSWNIYITRWHRRLVTNTKSTKTEEKRKKKESKKLILHELTRILRQAITVCKQLYNSMTSDHGPVALGSTWAEAARIPRRKRAPQEQIDGKAVELEKINCHNTPGSGCSCTAWLQQFMLLCIAVLNTEYCSEPHLYMLQYIKMEYWDLTLTILPPSKGYISQYTVYGVYRLIVSEINEGITSLFIYCQNW